MQKFPLSYQTQKMKNNMIAAFIVAPVLLVFCIISLVNALSEPATPIDILSADITTLKNGNVYKLDELYVADVYAEYGETSNFLSDDITKVEKQYFTGLVFDANDTLYAISFETKSDSDIMSAINAYLEDDEQGVGDLVIDGYFTARTGAISGDLLDYYNESVALYAEVFDLEQVYINLVYECDGNADYAAYAKAQQQKELFAAGMFFIFASATVAFAFFCRSKYQKQAKEDAEKARAWTTEEE